MSVGLGNEMQSFKGFFDFLRVKRSRWLFSLSFAFDPSAYGNVYVDLADCRAQADAAYKTFEAADSRANEAYSRSLGYNGAAYYNYLPIVQSTRALSHRKYIEWEYNEKDCAALQDREQELNRKRIEDEKASKIRADEDKRAHDEAAANALNAGKTVEKARTLAEATRSGKLQSNLLATAQQKLTSATLDVARHDDPKHNETAGLITSGVGAQLKGTSRSGVITAIQHAALDEIQRKNNETLQSVDNFSSGFRAFNATTGSSSANAAYSPAPVATAHNAAVPADSELVRPTRSLPVGPAEVQAKISQDNPFTALNSNPFPEAGHSDDQSTSRLAISGGEGGGEVNPFQVEPDARPKCPLKGQADNNVLRRKPCKGKSS